MNSKEFYNFCLDIGAAPDSKNFIVARSKFVDWMRSRGYAERTINNHAAPSRVGGIIHRLMSAELLSYGGLRRWCVPCVQKINTQKPTKIKTFVRTFSGHPPTGGGWITSSRLDDHSEAGLEWRLYRREYSDNWDWIKVAAIGQRVPHKANYWLCSKNGKLTINKNAILLQQHRPDIFNNLCADLEEIKNGQN